MQTVTLTLAGLTVAFETRFGDLARRGAAYLAPPGAVPDLTIRLSDAELAAERDRFPGFSASYTENILLYHRLAERMPAHDGFFFHAAVVEWEGRAYAFSGPSGIGKSTHSRLWQTHFGATFVNGDKPLIRRIGDEFFACGTPWCGKEGYNAPVDRPLAGLCFLSQAPANAISPLPRQMAAQLLLAQTVLPAEAEGVARQMALLDALTRRVPLWQMSCNISREAAVLSFSAMTGAQAPGKDTQQ